MSHIKKEFIETLLDKIRIEEVISDFVELKKSGATFKGLSPFTKESTPSFVVSPAKDLWKDFSSGKGGSAISFIMEFKNFTYPETIEYLASKYSMPLEYESPEITLRKKETRDKKEELRKTLVAIHKLYIEELANLPSDHPANLEIKRRGYTQEQVKELELGYAPSNFLYDKLYNSGKVSHGNDLGLIREGRNGKYDLYSNRLIYPIYDAQGFLIGLSGRRLDGKKNNKWINPPVNESNILYRKSVTWYGLNRALKEARTKKEIYIVEGYNDVIAFQEHGALNTVASCGTAIAPSQIDILRKHVEKVILVMDPDEAGQRAALKYIPDFLQRGIRVYLVEALPGGVMPGDPNLDPDDFCRVWKASVEKHGVDSMLNEKGVRTEGFLKLIESRLKGDAIEISKAAQEIALIIASIPDETTRRIYTNWLASESKELKKTVEEWVSKRLDKQTKENDSNFLDFKSQYKLPEGAIYDDVIKDIRKYGLFMHDNQIFYAKPKDSDGYIQFYSNSNFDIEYMMHIRDEKFPKKLIRVKNTFNEEMVFDTDSNKLNSLQSFYDTLTGLGNFRFDGNSEALRGLNRYLMDKMGSGIKIDVLGWQSDGFWVWNNRVIDEAGNNVSMSENGIIIFNNQHYYVPSANKIYKGLHKKYKAQKQFRVIENEIPFTLYLNKVKEVHREHSISAILFAIASLFLDIIESNLGRFPILFLYGPGGSGKDELAKVVQSFVGVPQEAINLEGDVSTAKARIREFAQFKNGISQLSEYRRGDQKLDGVLKGLWDRRGYKKANIESDISSDTVEIEASVILTGNEYPTTDALISRLIANEMLKNEFTEEEGRRFNELNDMTDKGVSGYAHELLKHRLYVKENFSKQQRLWKSVLQSEIPNAIGRIHLNYSILTAVYTLFRDTITFPFTQQEMLESFKDCANTQMRKINSGSIVTRFFEMFVASLRGTREDRLEVNKVVSIEGSVLFFNWRHTYAKLQRMWYIHFQEAAPANTSLLAALEKANIIYDKKAAHTFSPGQNGVRTSAVLVDLNNLEESLKNDILGSIMSQQYQIQRDMGQISAFESSAPPEDENIF